MCVAQRTSLGGATASTIAGRGERARAMARRALRAATLLCAVGRLSAQTTTVESGVSAVTERVTVPGHPGVPGHKTWRLYADTAKCGVCYNLYKLYGEPGVSRGAAQRALLGLGGGAVLLRTHTARASPACRRPSPSRQHGTSSTTPRTMRACPVVLEHRVACMRPSF